MSIAYKEARETSYWLRLLWKTEYIDEHAFKSIHDDCEELLKPQLGFLWIDGLLVFGGIVAGVGVLAGAYPALVLSGFKPAEVLRGAAGTTGQGAKLRKGLVVLQFSIAIALIAGTAVVFSQLRHMQRQDLGFEMKGGGQLLTINFNGADAVLEHLETVKRRLAQHPAVVGVAASAITPGFVIDYVASGTMERRSGATEPAELNLYMVDTDFIDVYGLNMTTGRAFSEESNFDSTMVAYILNEQAVKEHGFHRPREAIGRKATFWGEEGRVIGVVENFHDRGLQQEVPPMALRRWPSRYQMLTLRLQTDDVQEVLSELKGIWQQIAPGLPFDYRFLDEQFDAEYRAERRFGRIFSISAGLAILIACLGLFGLATFAAERRTKEIGIRKALGASVPNIVGLLSKDFLKLVGIAFIIAAPAAYFAMQAWLQDFAYRIELGVGIFVAAGILAVLIALATVSYQAVKAALADPVKALRSE